MYWIKAGTIDHGTEGHYESTKYNLKANSETDKDRKFNTHPETSEQISTAT